MAVALGLPGAWAADDDPADAFASRVGGAISVPATAASYVDPQKLTCKVCTSALSPLIQARRLSDAAYASCATGQASL